MTREKLKMAEYLARDGLSLEEIRRELAIAKTPWKAYLRKNPQEKERLMTLRKVVDYAVEDALLKRALGYVAEEHRETEKPNGSEAVTTRKDVPPDVRAAMMWLKCRRGDKWNEKSAADDNSKVQELLDEMTKEAEGYDE